MKLGFNLGCGGTVEGSVRFLVLGLGWEGGCLGVSLGGARGWHGGGGDMLMDVIGMMNWNESDQLELELAEVASRETW